jgi:hypothetical protein
MSFLKRLDDVALAFFTVALVVATVFALLGDLTVATVVLLGSIAVGLASFLLRTASSSSSSKPAVDLMMMSAQQPAELDERRRRILAATSSSSTNVLKLGVIGSTRDEALAAQVLSTLLVDLQVTSRKRVIVVTGWLAEGVALVAWREARRLGLPTVGFGCKLHKQNPDAKRLDCDEVYIVGRNEGDETLAFLTFIDGLVLLGDALHDRQTFREFSSTKPKFDLSTLGVPSEPQPQQVRNVDD